MKNDITILWADDEIDLLKPQIIFSIRGNVVAGEVGTDLGDHFGVFDGYRQVL